MKRIIITLIIGASAFYYYSCSYLNVDPYFMDVFSADSVFARKEYLEGYLWNTASYILPEASNYRELSYYPYMLGSDDAFWTYKRGNFPHNYFSANELDASSSYFQNWNHFYRGIRKTNTIMTRIDECKDATTLEKRNIIGYALFLRGYFYFKLLEQYGPVVIVPEEPQQFDQSIEELALPRNLYDECVEYISNDLTEAAAILPEEQMTSYWMRPTKGTALSLISRLRLYAASPQYNGNVQYYSNWVNENGDHFINQVENNEKWAVAAAAAKKVIDLGEKGLYGLHIIPRKMDSPELPPNVPADEFPDGAGGIDPYRSYSDMFNGETIMYKNFECIWGDAGKETTSIRYLQTGTSPLFVYGWNGLNTTQKLVDAYYMRDGGTIENNILPEYEYSETGYTTEDELFSNYIVPSGIFNMYAKREFRFYATIMFNGAKFYGLSTTGGAAYNNFYVNYSADGNSGMITGSDVDDRLLSGYTFRKYTHADDNFFFGKVSDKAFARIRYAEIILNYVEALNELRETYTIDGEQFSRDTEVMRKYFNMVRYRAGLPGLTNEELADPAALREIILKERFIEFALEGRRYHDMRRWKRLEDEYQPFEGMNVEALRSQPDQFHQRTRITHANVRRNYNRRLYFFPIPTLELDKNPALIQNPGW